MNRTVIGILVLGAAAVGLFILVAELGHHSSYHHDHHGHDYDYENYHF